MTRHSKVRGEGAICGEESEESRERRGVGVGRRTASSAVVTPDEEGKRVQFVGPDCILLGFFLLFFLFEPNSNSPHPFISLCLHNKF
jgi:hypothetical protein